MLFGHGDDHYNSQKEVKINFSSNVWHGADLRTLREHLNEQFYDSRVIRNRMLLP